ncbi:hypothetical protein GCM10023195_55430 [Actinoallomurus liliacearum]|uniref:Major facilitator superfamily (MFS) profile domain-containing protein n=1 Tax=Actinoallomurus liliacearum TaxID=1080073 RepID=A0ABP8TNZ1_9ACTN
MDRHHHRDRHRHTGVVHRRNHRAGASQGIAISAATRGLLHGSTPADRASIFGVIYLICYSAATFPSLISGQLSNSFSLPQIALGYGALALLATLFAVFAARNPCTDTSGSSQLGEWS